MQMLGMLIVEHMVYIFDKCAELRTEQIVGNSHSSKVNTSQPTTYKVTTSLLRDNVSIKTQK